jgi:hypothetical protein
MPAFGRRSMVLLPVDTTQRWFQMLTPQTTVRGLRRRLARSK